MIDPETSDFVDEDIVCLDCGQAFVFSAGEQEFYEQRGFKDKPKRCKECRARRKLDRENGVEHRPTSGQRHEFVCPGCGKPASVPFTPRSGKPVYCRECFKKQPKPERERR